MAGSDLFYFFLFFWIVAESFDNFADGSYLDRPGFEPQLSGTGVAKKCVGAGRQALMSLTCVGVAVTTSLIIWENIFEKDNNINKFLMSDFIHP